MFKPFLLLCLTLMLHTAPYLVSSKTKGPDRAIHIVNESGRRIDVYWVHPDTKELVKQTDPFVYSGASLPLNSFAGHTFQVREIPGSKSGVCGDPDRESTIGTCRMTYFTVNDNHEQSK